MQPPKPPHQPQSINDDDTDDNDSPQKKAQRNKRQTAFADFLIESMAYEMIHDDKLSHDHEFFQDDNKPPPLFYLQQTFKTKSAIIRHLNLKYKMSTKEISQHTGFLYQHVRNVLGQELKRGANENPLPNLSTPDKT